MATLEADLARLRKENPGCTKSDLIRFLYIEGYTDKGAISRAIPANYSQVHSVFKQEAEARTVYRPAPQPSRSRESLADVARKVVPTGREKAAQRRADAKVAVALGHKPASKAKQVKLRPGVGKLRIGSLPSDIPVGECANCGYDLVVSRAPTGFHFKHVNATPEEYLSTIQFCQAVPRSLL